LDFGFWILDFGFWILDFGFWILDFGFWIVFFILQSEKPKIKKCLSPVGNLYTILDSERFFYLNLDGYGTRIV
jgi:hypothetical protein